MSNDLSIILVIRNTVQPTAHYFDLLVGQVPPRMTYELIVVTDGATKVRVPSTYRKQSRVITCENHTNLAACYNAGTAVASGETLAFIASDLTPDEGWLRGLLRYAEGYPAAVIGSKLILPDQTVEHVGMVICQDRYPRNLYAGFPADHHVTHKSRRLQVVPMMGALVQRAPFEHAGGFDTAFPAGYADVDLCLRLGEQGYAIHSCHEAVVYHTSAPTERPAFGEDEDFDRLYRKQWAYRVQPDDMPIYVEDGLITMSYGSRYPARLAVSSLLATTEGKGREVAAERLLHGRPQQVVDLLKEIVRLTMRLGESDYLANARLESLAARVDLLASREDTLQSLLLDTREQMLRGDSEILAALQGVRATSDSARPQGAFSPDALSHRHQKLIHRIDYQQLTDQIRKIVRGIVPLDATVIVVSKGDDELLNLDGRRAWHFPQTEEGTYAGYHPDDSATAITHLQHLCDKGGNYLLFPNSAFWWLGYYGDFHRHLDDQYQRIWNDKNCIIYHLDTPREQAAAATPYDHELQTAYTS